MESFSKKIYLLAIETSCDETSIALMENNQVVKCLTWSQVAHFEQFGGVVPQIASQLHMEKLPVLLDKLMRDYSEIWNKIQYIAYTSHPGLIGCLRIGETMARTIALKLNLPLLPINHLEAHIYAAQLKNKIAFPALALIVSGGHTQLVYMPKELKFIIIGSTIDDAAGEILDKIARKLNLGYPGGPKIETLAKNGRPIHRLSVYNDKHNLNFSFSGLKTGALQMIEKQQKKGTFSLPDFAASFQQTIFQVLSKKVNLANIKYNVKNLVLCGGVAANQALREHLKKNVDLKLIVPEKQYCGDNAAMVGVLAFFQIKNFSQKNVEKFRQ